MQQHAILSWAIVLRFFCLFLPTFFCAEIAHADSVHLKNGDIITGSVVSYIDDVCVFNSKYGATVFFPTSEISNIYTDRSFEVVFKSGETIKGKLVQGNGGKTIMKSDNFGDFPVQGDKVLKMTAIFEAQPNSDTAKEKNSNTTKDSASKNSEPQSNEKKTATDKQTYGQNVDKEPPLDFLSGTTVLLPPRTFEFEIGLNYKQNRSTYPLVGYFEKSSYSARQLELGLAARAGLWDGAEGFLRFPFTYGRVKEVSGNDWVRSSERFDIGDISFGLQQTLHRESASLPAISASLSVAAPTGEKQYREVTGTWLDPLDNGGGHWAVTPGLSFVRTTDPAILFGGVNYQYSFENTINGYRVQPGWAVMGYLGVGFALNEKLSLGTKVSQGYYSEMHANRRKVEGSEIEPLDLAFTGSYRAWDNWVISPEVRFGLNDDAGSPSLGVRFTRRF